MVRLPEGGEGWYQVAWVLGCCPDQSRTELLGERGLAVPSRWLLPRLVVGAPVA